MKLKRRVKFLRFCFLCKNIDKTNINDGIMKCKKRIWIETTEKMIIKEYHHKIMDTAKDCKYFTPIMEK